MAHYQEAGVFQEIQEDDNFESGTIRLLANLHLNSSTTASGNLHLHPSTTAAASIATRSPVYSTRKRTVCGSMKRNLQSSSHSLKKAFRKRATLSPSLSTRVTATTTMKSPLLSNSTRPTPSSYNTIQHVPCILHTSLSEPMISPETREILPSPIHFLNPQSPEKTKNDTLFSEPLSPAVATLPSLPPPPRIPSLDYQMVKPLGPPVAAEKSSSFDQESPRIKRLKRMKKRMKEMTQWSNQVSREEDVSEDNKNEAEKAVRVKEINGGEGLIIHFKCPCGGDYEILLSENNCFYRIM